MHSTTLLSVFATVFAAVTTSREEAATASATSDALNTVNLDKALSLANSTEVVENEKRGLGVVFMVKAAFTWCNALLDQGICYSCGSSNLGCNSACCRCGASTQLSCSTC